jgi:hypothetical protein
VAPPGRCRAVAPAVGGEEAGRPPALRSGWATRLVVAATTTLAVVSGLAGIGNGTPHEGIPAETVTIQVGAGETLWDVAQRVAPQSDQRAVVDRIRQLNGIMGSAVQPGQLLQVPDGR